MLRIGLTTLAFLYLFICDAHAESSVWVLNTKKQNFYIAGSIHFLRKADYPLPEEFEHAYEKVDKIVFETSLDDSMQSAMHEMIMEKGIFPNGDSVEKHLSEAAYKQLKAYCEENNIPIANLNRMKPWLISLTLTVLELMRHNINPSDGLDIYYHQKAIHDNKQTGGLVPINEHVEIISAFGEDLNDEIIINELNELSELVRMLDELIIAWRHGDEKTINEWITKSMRNSSPKIYQKVITDRNKHWVGITEKLIKSKENIMIIVGVGHLVGEDSLIRMLGKKGYKFTKLDIKR